MEPMPTSAQPFGTHFKLCWKVYALEIINGIKEFGWSWLCKRIFGGNFEDGNVLECDTMGGVKLKA